MFFPILSIADLVVVDRSMSSGSSASAPVGKEGFPEMLKIVCSMLSRNESLVFREPVDWKGMGLTDYPEIVKKPMDLGTVKKKIENDEYETMEEIALDIRLVWTNCMLYNRDGSEVCFVDFCDRSIDRYSTIVSS